VSYFLTFIVGILGLTSTQLFAQSSAAYPEKPITIIVPYPPGGFNDTLGRIVGKKLGEAWGVNVVIDNKPGAGTTIGTNFVARSTPDGYTILVAQFPFAANPYLYKSLPYDTLKAFSPVVLAGRSPMVLVVNSNSPIKTMSEFLALAKAKAGSVNYGSSGPGSSNHLAMVLFEMMAGVSLNQVPYKGSVLAILHQLTGGIRSSMGYLGCKTIDELHEKANFVEITSAGVRESHVHDVKITKEAPNYHID